MGLGEICIGGVCLSWKVFFWGISEVTMNLGVTWSTCPCCWCRSVEEHLFTAVPWQSWSWVRAGCGAKGAVIPLLSNPGASSAALCSRSPCKHVSIVLAAAAGAPQGMGCLQMRLQIGARVMPGAMGRIWEIPALLLSSSTPCCCVLRRVRRCHTSHAGSSPRWQAIVWSVQDAKQ